MAGRRPRQVRVQEEVSRVEAPLAFAPQPPEGLDAAGRAYWLRVVPLLVERGALTVLHLEPLEALCDQWGRYQALKRWLAEDVERWTFTTESGFQVESPQARQLYQALKELERLWAKFGLTPHAEPRLEPKGSGRRGFDPAAGLMAAAGEKTRYDEEQRPPGKR